MNRKFFPTYHDAAAYAADVYGYRYTTALAQLEYYGELRATVAVTLVVE